MGDNFTLLWSVLMVAIFAFGAFQTWNGKQDFVGKNMDHIKPEFRASYCKEMSIPMFMLAGVEMIDVILQLTIDFQAWSMLLLGTGILIGIIWIVMIQRKYNKM